jgi:hypothetical protein
MTTSFHLSKKHPADSVDFDPDSDFDPEKNPKRRHRALLLRASDPRR